MDRGIVRGGRIAPQGGAAFASGQSAPAEAAAHAAAPRAQQAAATPGPAATAPRATAVVFNPEEAMTRCFDSKDMLREMVRCFFDEVDNLFPQMRAALEKGDLVEVGRLGHRMKGTVVYLGAQGAKEAATRLEQLCDSNGVAPAEAEEAINTLQRECNALKAALIEHLPAAAQKASDDAAANR